MVLQHQVVLEIEQEREVPHQDVVVVMVVPPRLVLQFLLPWILLVQL